jgi:hypothetical protein
MKAQCSFCFEPASTKEHVIPRWLQRHYNLKDQIIGLRNGSHLKYSQAVIPACATCNSERFSRLERAVQNGTATLEDYYLWALKIRYGLAIRDSTLLLDRSKPERGMLLSRREAEFGEAFIKHAFKALDDPQFTFHPSPFGSVFVFDAPAEVANKFDLIDVPPPFWALSIVIPPGSFLVVLFADRGVVRRCLTRYTSLKGELEKLAKHLPALNARVLLFSILRWQNHLILPARVWLGENSLVGETPAARVKIRRQKLEWYYEMAKYCALSDEIAVDAFHRDQTIFANKSLSCK